MKDDKSSDDKESYSDLSRRVKQLELNCKWLIDITDSVCYSLVPDFIGTWQDRAKMAAQKAKELEKLNTEMTNKSTKDNFMLYRISIANNLQASQNPDIQFFTEHVKLFDPAATFFYSKIEEVVYTKTILTVEQLRSFKNVHFIYEVPNDSQFTDAIVMQDILSRARVGIGTK